MHVIRLDVVIHAFVHQENQEKSDGEDIPPPSDRGGSPKPESRPKRTEAGRPLNETEQNILQAVEEAHQQGTMRLRGEEVAIRAGHRFNAGFKATLACLVKRGLLDNDKSGYFKPDFSQD